MEHCNYMSGCPSPDSYDGNVGGFSPMNFSNTLLIHYINCIGKHKVNRPVPESKYVKILENVLSKQKRHRTND